jgi:hypothetical protein
MQTHTHFSTAPTLGLDVEGPALHGRLSDAPDRVDPRQVVALVGRTHLGRGRARGDGLREEGDLRRGEGSSTGGARAASVSVCQLPFLTSV